MSPLETASNTIVAKSPPAGKKIEMAAMHMDGTAQVLAKGIVSAKGISGSVTGAGSSLRAALTGLLIQHVAATAFVVQTAVAHGGNLTAPQVKGAIGALADNTNQLGAAIGSVYGPAAQAQFLKLWRAHIGFFVNYTLGVATHNAAKAAAANQDLAGYTSQFSQFIAIVAKSPSAGKKIELAAMHMDGTAQVLAKGIVSAKGISGSVTGAGSSLRAALTGLLIQHVAATAFVVQTAVAHGGNLTAPQVKGAIVALADNTNQLGAAIGSVYGPAAQAQFL